MDFSRRQKSSSHKSKSPISQSQHSFENIGKQIPITAIKLPQKQPRRSFNPTKMQHLTESVRKYGILEPLIVRPVDSQEYQLVAGERRYKAAKEVGLTKVPVIIKELDDKQAFELALLENLQRDDLNPIDETEGMLELLCQSLNCDRNDVISLLNQAANAQRRNIELTDNVKRQIEIVDSIFLTVGRLNRESYRTNRLPLLNLPEDVLEVLRSGELEYTKAKVIAKLDDPEMRQQLMRQVIDEKMSLKQLKEKITELMSSEDIEGQWSLTMEEHRLRERYISILEIKSDAWRDKNKQKEINTILFKLERILGTEGKEF